MNGIQLDILNGETDINFGSIYENAVAQELKAHGFNPAYYNSGVHGEVDFVIERGRSVLPIEVKSGKHYKRHRALNHVLSEREYNIPDAIVFDDAALRAEGKVFYAPIYMMMFIEPRSLPSEFIYDMVEPLEFVGSKQGA